MKRIAFLVCMVVVIATTGRLFPCRISAQIKTDWSANWIWMPQDGRRIPLYAFAKHFILRSRRAWL